MLYKGYSIRIWKTEWIGRLINGEYFSLHPYCYHDMRMFDKDNKYIAIIDKVNPYRSFQIWGGSTPRIAIDLAKFSINLNLVNYRRWNVEERFRKYNQKCLKHRLEMLSKNT
jgi:hypothetical protein